MEAADFSGPEIKQALDETVKEMGLSSLKSKQTEAIFAVVAGKYTFVSFPTWYGKSAQQHLSLMTATPWPGLSFYVRCCRLLHNIIMAG